MLWAYEFCKTCSMSEWEGSDSGAKYDIIWPHVYEEQ